MNQEESERFRQLADENLELVYEAIKTSSEPWWGLGVLSNREFFRERDEDRTNELIELRSDCIIEALRESDTPWEITWNMSRYLWFFEREETLDALAEAIEKSEAPWQVFSDLKHHRILMENKSLQSAFRSAIQHNRIPSSVISSLRDFIKFLSEEETVKAIVSAINSVDDCSSVISEVTRLRVLDENPQVQRAIRSRIGDVARSIKSSGFRFHLISELRHLKELLEDERIINAIVSAIRSQEDAFSKVVAVASICHITTLTKNKAVQQAVADTIEEINPQSICRVLRDIGESRPLYESEFVQSAVSERMDAIESSILESELPQENIEDIGTLLEIVGDERIRGAIKKRLPDVVTAIRANGTQPSIIWDFFERCSRISEVYHHPAMRELIATNGIMKDVYGMYTHRIGRFPSLVDDSIIRDALLRAIREFEEPAWFICSLESVSGIYENEEVQAAILARVPRIVALIETDYGVENLTSEIANNKFLMQIEEVSEAVFAKIRSNPTPWKLIAGLPRRILDLDFIKEIIDKGSGSLGDALWDEYNDCLDWSITRILRSLTASKSSEVRSVLDAELENMIEEIDSVWEVWYSVSFVEDIPYYAQNERVLSAIRGRTEDIAHAFGTRADWSIILNIMSPYSEILADEVMIKSIVRKIQDTHEPYSIFDSDALESLVQSKEVRSALVESIPDLIFGIRYTVAAPLIVRGIESVEFLQDSPGLVAAMREYQQAVR